MDHLLKKKLVVFTGKGGIGKTICAAALGCYAASKGIRTLLVERSEKEQLAPLFAKESEKFQEIKVLANLTCLNLDAAFCLEEYIVKQLGQKKLFEKVFSNNLVKTFFNTIPGLAEVMILGKIFHNCELAEPRQFDLVIFDAPASGHMLNLMTTPDAVIDSGIGGPLVREVTRVKNFLQDSKKCEGVLVTVPEALVSTESLEFLPMLDASGPLRMGTVIVNKCIDFNVSDQLAAYQLVSEKHPEIQKSIDYIFHKMKRSEAVQKQFVENVHKIPLRERLSGMTLIPDYGMITEPLNMSFGEKFLHGVLKN